MTSTKIRRKFITDAVKHYVEKYPEEYADFKAQMDARRVDLADKKHATADKAKDIRLAVSMPSRLYNMLLVALNGDEEPLFCDEKKELAWFSKKFPQFLIPNEY